MIIQIIGNSEGNPTYALTDTGCILSWQMEQLPFGGNQYCFKYLEANNVQPNVTPALGFLRKLISSNQAAVESDNLADIVTARLKSVFGNCTTVQTQPELKFTVWEGETKANFKLTVTELPSSANMHLGKFVAYVVINNTREDFKGWWRSDAKTIGFSK